MTQEIQLPIVERLNATKAATLGEAGLVNPDGPEAAATIQGLVRALEEAAETFREYQKIHAAKLPENYRDAPANWKEIALKVERNRALAERMEAALKSVRGNE